MRARRRRPGPERNAADRQPFRRHPGELRTQRRITGQRDGGRRSRGRSAAPAATAGPFRPPGGIEAQTRHHDVGMATVGIDRDPAALAALAVTHEARRVARAVRAVLRRAGLRDGSGAVVPRGLEAPVTAAVAVRLAGDPVGRGDRAHHRGRRARRRDRGPAVRGQHGATGGRRRGGGRARRAGAAPGPDAGEAAVDAVVLAALVAAYAAAGARPNRPSTPVRTPTFVSHACSTRTSWPCMPRRSARSPNAA